MKEGLYESEKVKGLIEVQNRPEKELLTISIGGGKPKIISVKVFEKHFEPDLVEEY